MEYGLEIAMVKIAIDIEDELEIDSASIDFMSKELLDKDNQSLTDSSIKVAFSKEIEVEKMPFNDKFYSFDIYYDDSQEYRILTDEEKVVSKFIFQNNKKSHFLTVLDHPAFHKWKASNLLGFISLEKILLQNDGIILHSSFVEINGVSLLFSGISGIGKSTQADYWVEKRNAEIINGDKSALRKINGRYYSFGLPVAGSSQIFKNKKYPVGAIVLLQQGEKFAIRKLAPLEAFVKLYPNVTINYWDKNYVERASTIIRDIISTVPILEFTCPLSELSVEYLEDYLLKEDVINE